MDKKDYEFLIVGSGAGGATLARELVKRGRKVLVVEKGIYEQKVGTLADTFRFYDMSKLLKVPRKSMEGVIIWRTFMAGGTTVVACANGVRCMEKELAGYGIHGTTEPESIGYQCTEGCVRMRNADVEELFAVLPVGAEVTVID